jgi:hypothetical protein
VNFKLTTALTLSAAVFFVRNPGYYFVGLTTVTEPPKLRSLLWKAA